MLIRKIRISASFSSAASKQSKIVCLFFCIAPTGNDFWAPAILICFFIHNLMIDGKLGYEETLISISLESSIQLVTLFKEGILSTIFLFKLILPLLHEVILDFFSLIQTHFQLQRLQVSLHSLFLGF